MSCHCCPWSWPAGLARTSRGAGIPVAKGSGGLWGDCTPLGSGDDGKNKVLGNGARPGVPFMIGSSTARNAISAWNKPVVASAICSRSATISSREYWYCWSALCSLSLYSTLLKLTPTWAVIGSSSSSPRKFENTPKQHVRVDGVPGCRWKF